PSGGVIVSDEIGLIRVEQRQEIERIGNAMFKETGFPAAVVTIKSLAAQRAGGYTIERYAKEIVDAWKMEPAHRSHGMLLLVSEEDRRARIQLAPAWGNAHDGRAQEVMDSLILPAFRRGDLSQGILDGVRGFDAMARGLAIPSPPRPCGLIPVAAAGGLLLVAGVVSLAKSGRKSWAFAIAGIVGGIVLARGPPHAPGGGGGPPPRENGAPRNRW